MVSAMFTGIVQQLSKVVGITNSGGIRQFAIDLADGVDHLELGASVAINGTCLTAVKVAETVVFFDVIAETLLVTNLGGIEVGDLVNIERSLRYGDEIGGHILSGHVAGTMSVTEIEVEGDNRTMWFDVPAEHMPYLMWKGFVALNGASLTISRLDREKNLLAVSLIPETLSRTTLGQFEVGSVANLELDATTQTIVQTVKATLADNDLLQTLASSS